MPLRLARTVPAIAGAALTESAAMVAMLSFTSTLICDGSSSVSAALAPLTVTVLPATLSATPFGRLSGCLAPRDMWVLFSLFALRHDAEDFAADAGRARLLVRQHALRRGQDGDAQAAEHLRHFGAVLVHAQR